MTTKRAAIALDYVLERDGHHCANIDGKLFENPNCTGSNRDRLRLDHIDNIPSNNDPKNWQALCHSCNVKKNPRGKSKRGIRMRERLQGVHRDKTHGKHSLERESERGNANLFEQAKTYSKEYEKNQRCEGKYRGWVVEQIMKNGKVSWEDAVHGGAEFVGASQQTIIRYLQKLCSSMGLCRVTGSEELRNIVFKEAYRSLGRDELLENQARNLKDFEKIIPLKGKKHAHG